MGAGEKNHDGIALDPALDVDMPRADEYILPTTLPRHRSAFRKDPLMTRLDRHLDEQALLMFHYHQLEPETYQRLAGHLEECVSCRQKLDRLGEVLVQSPAPELQLGAVDQSKFWMRMRRHRRLRRLRRGLVALLLLSAVALLLVWRYPQWQPLQLLRDVPASEQPAHAAPVKPAEPFNLPLGEGWLQRYLSPPASDYATPSD